MLMVLILKTHTAKKNLPNRAIALVCFFAYALQTKNQKKPEKQNQTTKAKTTGTTGTIF
jgi:hypothetical protein